MQGFDYDSATRQRYRNAARARRYYSRYNGRGLKHLRGRFVAHRERQTLRNMIAPHMPGVVLDVPGGTGKMAPVFADLGATVISADISEAMSSLAEEEYRRLGYQSVAFVTCDAESVATVRWEPSIDVACCIRLLHRVPRDVRGRILENLAEVAPVVVVSYSIMSPFQCLRGMVLRKKGALSDRTTRGIIESELGAHFHVLEARPIARGICSEWFFLTRPNTVTA